MSEASGGCPFHPPAARIRELFRSAFHRPRPDGSVPRSFHAKGHGCVRGHLRIEPAVDARWHGLFSRAADFPALIRFSSTLLPVDCLADGRGLAIKLHGVEGEVCDGAPSGYQDFVLVNGPATPFANATDSLALLRVLAWLSALGRSGGRSFAPPEGFASLGLRHIRWPTLARRVALMIWGHMRCRDLTRYRYYSVTPYQLGDGAAKYELRPVPLARPRPKPRGPNFRARLQFALDQGPLRFDFFLQPRTVEGDALDAADRPWTSPVVRVGRLEIPPQDPTANDALGETLAFDSWNCLRAHTPLGSVNEARRLTYRESAARSGGDPRFPPFVDPPAG